RGALQVKPRQGRRAHGVKRKAALVIGIDPLVFGRRRFGQAPDPAEWIFAIMGRERGSGNARPANTVKAVAPADKVAGKLSLLGARSQISCTLPRLPRTRTCPPPQSRRSIKSFTRYCWP